jgi:hypothetical protein
MDALIGLEDTKPLPAAPPEGALRPAVPGRLLLSFGRAVPHTYTHQTGVHQRPEREQRKQSDGARTSQTRALGLLMRVHIAQFHSDMIDRCRARRRAQQHVAQHPTTAYKQSEGF